MKAQVVHEFGSLENLSYQDFDEPSPGAGQVLIGVEAVGLNFPDLLMIEGKYQFRPDLPFAPGAEAAGTVLAAGEGVTGVEAGDRVIGSGLYGAMAERFVAPAANVYRLPAEVSMPAGACLSMTYGTGYHALVDRARLRAGETLLVTGASGGTGSAAVQLGKTLGARVIAAVGTDAKAEAARESGADETINYSSESLRERTKELTEGRGADVIYEVVGGDVFLECLRCVNWEGRILVVGFTSGQIAAAPANLPLLKGCSIVGVFWGAFASRAPRRNRANLKQALAWAAEGKINPRISAVRPLAEAKQALAAFADRSAVGKIVLSVP